MKSNNKAVFVAIYAVILLLIVSVSFMLGSDDNDDNKDTDLVGTWHLVAKESYDQDRKYSVTVDSKYDIEILGFDESKVLFNAESQGIFFNGAFINNSIVFEYRYEDETCIRADGYMEAGKLILYETHFYSIDHWFVAMSVYSKTPGEIRYDFPSAPIVNKTWNAKLGVSINESSQYEIKGKKFVIQDQKSALFRAEMEQVYGSGIITRVMNGIFVSHSDGAYVAFMMDESGKMWTLYLRDDLAILNTIVHSETEGYIGVMVATQRSYYDGIPPLAPDYPPMDDTTWKSDTVRYMWGNGEQEKVERQDTLSYTVQESHLFAGNSVNGTVSGNEVAYSVLSRDAVEGKYLLRLGSQSGSDDIREGYGFLNEDGTQLFKIEFEYVDGRNGISYSILALS